MRIPSKFLFLPFILTRFLRMRLLMTPRHLLLIPMVRVLLSIEIRWVRLVLNKAMGQQQDQEQERVLKRGFTLRRLSYLVFYLIFCLIFHLIFCLLLCPYLSYDIISPLSSHAPPLDLSICRCKAFQLNLERFGAPQLLIITKCNFRISATPIIFLHHSVFFSNAVLSSYWYF